MTASTASIPPRGIGIWWLLASMGGLVLGLVVALTTVLSLNGANRPSVVVGIVAGALLGATIGMAQWLVLRPRLAIDYRWVIASLAGGAVGVGAAVALAALLEPTLTTLLSGDTRPFASGASAVLGPIMQGMVIGGILGLAQQHLLGPVTRAALWWIPVNVLAWALGLGAASMVGEQITIVGALVVLGVIYGGITAIGLNLLLRRPA